MTISRSPEAYTDCYKTMDLAVESKIGIRMLMPDPNKAYYFRMRCHNARAIRRKLNAKTYEEGHPMYNTSSYDCLSLTIDFDRASGKCYLTFTKNEIIPGPIEDLADLPPQVNEVEFVEVKRLEPPRDEIAPELSDIVQSIRRRI